MRSRSVRIDNTGGANQISRFPIELVACQVNIVIFTSIIFKSVVDVGFFSFR